MVHDSKAVPVQEYEGKRDLLGGRRRERKAKLDAEIYSLVLSSN